MTFEDALQRDFPGAIPAITYVSWTQSALGRHGFSATSALACLVMCSDELTDGLRQDLRRAWGSAFDAASLGGVPSLGRTGVAAAIGHAPLRSGRRRMVCFALTHIGIGPEGQPGWCRRPGLEAPSEACGALAALCRAAGQESCREGELDDPQLRWLAQRLDNYRPASDDSCLVELTRSAVAVAYEALRDLLAQVADLTAVDYALFSGVQVHGPSGREYVWPAQQLLVEQGVEKPLRP